ncbi:MAG: YraN family protein [Anaerolineae bacterium]|nr:YraN family protein [Anaerolineae bacterium]
MASRSEVGQWGEGIAAKYLIDHGYVIRHRNWRHGHGELDIVAALGERIHFVEVRLRRSEQFGKPEETLDARKQAKLIATAQAYLEQHDLLDQPAQIDVIIIELGPRNAITRLEHLEAAIEA